MNQLVTKDENRQAVVASEVEQPQGAGALLSIIDRMATMPELDIDRVERMFAMHQQMLDRQAEQQFNEAMAWAQRDIQPIAAKKQNKHTKSSYADIDAIHAEAKPIWTGYGLSVVTRTGKSDIANHIKMYTQVRHAGGHKECYEDDWPLDTAGAQGTTNKTAIQGKGSTITYARRYTELMIFDIAVDHDTDGAPPDNRPLCVTPTQIAELRKAAKVAGVDDAYICKKAQINRVEELQQQRLAGAINHLKSIAMGEQK